ncbi:hypothetical protein SNEBB_000002, partial [Seison nebaliae]
MLRLYVLLLCLLSIYAVDIFSLTGGREIRHAIRNGRPNLK